MRGHPAYARGSDRGAELGYPAFVLGRIREIALGAPTIRALGLALRGRERAALALLGLVLSYALLTATEVVSTTMQESLIACAHFRPRSLASWVVLQPVPKMYVHENRVFVDSGPPPGGPLSDAARRRFERGAFFVNHYPARIARFDGRRRETFGPAPHARFLVLRTRYRDTTATTLVIARTRDGHLVLTPTEVRP